MRVKTYGSLTQLTFLSTVFPINAYIYEEANSLTVIDIGVKGFVPVIRQISQKLGKPVGRLLLTHAHGDHTGSLDEFRQTFKAEILISARDARLLAGDLTLLAGESLPIKGGFSKVVTRQTGYIEDGMTVGSLQAIATPGHTPGRLAFYAAQTKTLIAGDALQTRGGLAVAGYGSWTFPFVNFGTWDRALAVKSARKLAQLDINYLATGHGNVLQQPAVQQVL